MKPTVVELVGKLEALGSGRQIADFFQREGVRGFRDDGVSCPVARYLRYETGSWDVLACAVFVQLGHGAIYLRDDSPITEFIVNFDAGAYPALEVTP